MDSRSNLLLASILTVAIIAGVAGFRLLYSQSTSPVGYAVIVVDGSRPAPVASALFTYSNAAGVMVSQAGVGAAVPILSGRIVVDEAGTQTAIALVNPSSQTASATLILRDSSGNLVKQTSQSLTPRQHLARYVREIFPDMPAAFTGSLSFDSDQALAALTLREGRNGYGESLYATLPVVDLTAAATSESFTFPQIAVGEGYTTQLILINRASQSVRGQIRLTASDGRPLLARLSAATVSEVPYDIAAQGIFKATLEGLSGLSVGYAVVTPDAGTPVPSGAAVFRYSANGQLVTEAGVLAAPMTTTARIFVDQIGTRTGVAIANPATQRAAVTLVLMDRSGYIEATVSRTLESGMHLAVFADELFTNVGDGFTGVMEIRSNVAIAPVTLKVTRWGTSKAAGRRLRSASVPSSTAKRRFEFEMLEVSEIRSYARAYV